LVPDFKEKKLFLEQSAEENIWIQRCKKQEIKVNVKCTSAKLINHYAM
jgi:hypothetical protein